MIKPPAGARPRFGHSFALGLRHAFLLNERSGRQVRDCVTGMHGYFHTGQEPLWGGGAGPDGYFPTMHGSSLLFSGTQYVDGFDGAVFSRGAGEGPFSIIVGFSVAAGSAGTAQTLWGADSHGLLIDATHAVTYYPFGAGHVLTTAEYRLPHVASVSWKNDVLSYMFDGWDEIGPVSAVNAKLVATNIMGAWLLFPGFAFQYLYGGISFLYVYDRFIAPSLMSQIHADPFAAFMPLRVYVPGAAASSGTVKARRSLSALGTRAGVRQVQS